MRLRPRAPLQRVSRAAASATGPCRRARRRPRTAPEPAAGVAHHSQVLRLVQRRPGRDQRGSAHGGMHDGEIPAGIGERIQPIGHLGAAAQHDRRQR